MTPTSSVLPYCGPPPSPTELLGAWNGDVYVLAALALLAASGWWAQRRHALAWGWLVLVVVFVSPLCALTVALFSARTLHHVLLLTLAAPLLGAAFTRLGARVAPRWSLLATVIALVLWHVPSVYVLAWHSHAVYGLLQVALLLPAAMFWSRIFATLRVQHQPAASMEVVAALAHIAVLAGVMGLIGAVLTFAPDVLYPAHGLAPLFYGLTPLQDQQLAGLLMWVPGFVPLAAIAAWGLYQTWQRALPPLPGHAP